MKTGKKILSLILVVIMLFSAASINSITATSNSTEIKAGDEIEFGSYPQSAIKDENGNVTGYNNDPIKWRVLTVKDGKALLLSSEILDFQAYHNTASTVGGYYPNNYARSTVRQWLINNFYNEAFSNTEQEVILTTTLDNSAAATNIGASGSYTQYSSVSTNDKVFLLSKDEANSYASKYFNASATDYAYSKGYATTSGAGDAKGAIWLLRTAGNNVTQLYYVHMRWGEMVTYFNWSGEGVLWPMGVRPAMYLDLKAYDEMLNGKFLEGYDKFNDKYSFPNLEETIDLKYYQFAYGILQGKALFEKKESKVHGHCFGMAYSVNSIINDLPAVSNFSGSDTISKLDESTYNESLWLDVRDYIKFCHIYQHSYLVNNYRDADSYNGIQNVYNAVYDSVYNGGNPVLIDLYNIDEMGNKTDGHTVYAIGIKGTDIIINDSNYPDASTEKTRIKVTGDSWEYVTPYYTYSSNKGSIINFVYTDTTIYDNLVNPKGNFLSTDKNLLVGSSSVRIKNEELIEINSTEYVESNNSNKCYWVDCGEYIFAENNSNEFGTFSVIGKESSIEYIMPENSKVKTDIEKQYAEIETENEKNITVSFTMVDDNDLIKLAIDGSTSFNIVTATQTESGIVVTGISDGTVTLSKNDEVIATQEIVCSDGTTNIIYDKNGEKSGLELDYEEEHTYTSVVTAPTCTEQGYTTYTCDCGDTYSETIEAPGHKFEGLKCINCDYEKTKDCTCGCHKNKIIDFIYTVIDLIFTAFGGNFDCDCGKSHF